MKYSSRNDDLDDVSPEMRGHFMHHFGRDGLFAYGSSRLGASSNLTNYLVHGVGDRLGLIQLNVVS
jgi:hypothetical protein